MGCRGFGLEEGTLGRAKEKQSGFSAIASFISRYKLHGMNSVLAVLVFIITGIINYTWMSVLSAFL